MPASGSEKSRPNLNSRQSEKFDEIRKKNLAIIKERSQWVEDSDEGELEEIDKQKINELFKNYQGNEVDVARITQFFESGENVDCLICNNLNQF